MALNPRIDAVVLAGGPRDALAALAPGAPNKAFVPVAGTSLVARTLSALRSAPSVGTLTSVAPLVSCGSPDLAAADRFRVAGTTMVESLRSGLRDAPPDELVLVCASDLPVLTAAAVEEFLALAVASSADLVYACVERKTHLAKYPDVPHTWARLRDGTYCGAGCVALRPRVLAGLGGLLGRLGAARKNPLRLASIFGPSILTRYAVGRLTLPAVERRATMLVGCKAAAAVCTHPEIAVNVDRLGDFALAARLIGRAPAITLSS